MKMVSCRHEPGRGNRLGPLTKFCRTSIGFDGRLGFGSEREFAFVSLATPSCHGLGSFLGGGAPAEVFLSNAISVPDRAVVVSVRRAPLFSIPTHAGSPLYYTRWISLILS